MEKNFVVVGFMLITIGSLIGFNVLIFSEDYYDMSEKYCNERGGERVMMDFHDDEYHCRLPNKSIISSDDYLNNSNSVLRFVSYNSILRIMGIIVYLGLFLLALGLILKDKNKPMEAEERQKRKGNEVKNENKNSD